MSKIFRLAVIVAFLLCFAGGCGSQNADPDRAEIYTSDINNFWKAFDKSKPEFEPKYFEEIYLSHGSSGLKGFMSGRIQNAENLAKVVLANQKYYGSIRSSTDSIAEMTLEIKRSYAKLKVIYPQATFPPVYFVIGALNSGGTTSKDGIIIGAEMYGVSPQTDRTEVDKNKWLQMVLKPVRDIPHIVAHELIHIQQTSRLFSSFSSLTLLEQSIHEGAADFLSELISGKHINEHVHEFADPKEQELWYEFKTKMNGKDYSGWLYGSNIDRPNDLGYWIGYKITKAYYDNAEDKNKAVYEILHINNANDFLNKSGYLQAID